MFVIDRLPNIKHTARTYGLYVGGTPARHQKAESPRYAKAKSLTATKRRGRVFKEFLGEFAQDKEFISKVANLVRWHMQILHGKGLPFADIKQCFHRPILTKSPCSTMTGSVVLTPM